MTEEVSTPFPASKKSIVLKGLGVLFISLLVLFILFVFPFIADYSQFKNIPVEAEKNFKEIYSVQVKAKEKVGTYLMADELDKFDPNIVNYYPTRYGHGSDLDEESDVYIVLADKDTLCMIAVEHYKAKDVTTLGRLNVYQAASMDQSGKITYANKGTLCADASTNLSELPRFEYHGFTQPGKVWN
jgi:hypothetical protein